MPAPLRILRDVFWFRARRLEMANLVAAASLVLVLGLPLGDAAVRLLAALLLNLLAYLINDHCDVQGDLAAGRAPEKTRFLAANLRAAGMAEGALVALLVGIALLHDPGMLVGVAGGAGLCWLYSAHLKARPFLDVASMALWGAAMPLVAVPLDRPLGVLLALNLGVYSAAFELIQVLRDRADDARAGIRTSAVVWGEEPTVRVLRVTYVLAAAFPVLVLGSWVGLLALLALLVPWTPAAAERYWTRIRGVLGLTWVLLLVDLALRPGP